MGIKKISTGYDPRPLQAKLHGSLRRFNVICCHRRFGKTVFSINEMVDRGLRNTRKNPRYAYLAPLYGQAKRVAWDYLKMYTANIPGATPNEADLRVDIPRPALGDTIRFTLLGADNPASLKGIYLDGVILDEYAEMNPTVWREVIRPTLSDRGGWAIFIGTPKGQNGFFEVFERAKRLMVEGNVEWFAALYKASETGILPQSELDSARAEMTIEEYEQEFECSFSAGLVGAYYSREMDAAEREGRIRSVPYDPAILVTTHWDLGIGDTNAIWFKQIVGREIHYIDYIEESGRGLDYYAKLIKEKPYIYEAHWLPHDAAARELGTGHTRQETLNNYGIRGRILQKQTIDDRINAARKILPRAWFDREKCARGIKALQNYVKAWDAKNNMFKSAPLHNWASNGADAFGYSAQAERTEMDSRQAVLHREAVSEYEIFSHARGGF